MAKSYKVRNLEQKWKDSNAIARAIKKDIDTHEGPDWSLNHKIQRFNKQVRISKAIKESLLNAIAGN
jgi:hypothetical protein